MVGPIRRRTRARELTLQFLYMLEMRGSEAMEELEPFVDHHVRRGPDRKGAQEIADFTYMLVNGVADNREVLNLWIECIAKNWRLERMAHIDRNVLRMAIYELLHHPDVPFKVVINEAIDIAKRFSTSQSGSFVNGILDRARVLIEEKRVDNEDGSVPPPPDVVLTAPSAPRAAVNRPEPVPAPRPRDSSSRREPDPAGDSPAATDGSPTSSGETPAPASADDSPASIEE